MKYYFAPLEGITGYIYRNAHAALFEPADKYFSPFIVPKPNTGKIFGTKELEDILPEHNRGLHLVPQIMSCKAEDFIKTANGLREYGYQEVNLNLGCPSKTVVSKKRGAGFLAYPEELERFLDEIVSKLDMKLSIKTRIGKDTEEEWERLWEIYQKFPLEECIIHPRTQAEYYKGTVHLECVKAAVQEKKQSVCYNGDIFCTEDYKKITNMFPDIKAVMLGRGLLANAGLIGEIKGKGKMKKEQLRMFHDRLVQEYQKVFFGDKNVLFKMKEFWCYAAYMFTDREGYMKKIRKAQKMDRYLEWVEKLFEEQDII